MTVLLKKPASGSIPLQVVDAAGFDKAANWDFRP